MNSTTKYCTSCDQTKPISDFTKSGTNGNWKSSADVHSYCKACNAARAREWRAKHKNYRGSGRVTKIPVQDRPLMSLVRHRLSCAKTRIKKFNQIETDLDEDYLFDLIKSQNETCLLTGIPFVYKKSHPLCPSLDKIESDKGYVKGNVQWLSWAVNRAKGDLDTHDFVSMCKRVVEISERATTIP